MATASAVLASIADQIEAVAVTSRAQGDTLREVYAAEDLLGRDRAFVLEPLDLPDWPDILGTNMRRLSARLIVHYADTPQARARALDDGRLILDALWSMPANVTAVDALQVTEPGTLDGEQIPQHLMASFGFLFHYDAS